MDSQIPRVPGFYDMHCHTYYSRDSEADPVEILACARVIFWALPLPIIAKRGIIRALPQISAVSGTRTPSSARFRRRPSACFRAWRWQATCRTPR